MSRGHYNEILSVPAFAKDLINAAEQAGVYERGIESDRRQRGQAVNVDLYGYDETQGLIVVQVRQCIFHPRRYPRIRKNYFLLGRTEQGNVFAHPIDSPVRSKRAMASPEAGVRYVLSQIWDCPEDELHDITRQGDIAFVPADLPTGAVRLEEPSVTLRETHVVTGELYRANGTYFVKGKAHMQHTKRQHAPVRVRGFYRIQPAIRATVWAFTAPRLGD